MKRTACRVVAAIAIVIGSTAAAGSGVVEAREPKAKPGPTVTCEKECPKTGFFASRGIRW